MPIAIFYISGHGFGHAVRMAEVIRRLNAIAPQGTVYICTTAPKHLFARILHPQLNQRDVNIDAGIVEAADALSIDVRATAARLEPYFHGSTQLINTEADFIRTVQAEIVVADIPHLAGEIGRRAGVPVVGISNFTWDFIYEPFLAQHAQGRAMLEMMKHGYDCMSAVLRLPFHHEMQFACPVIDVGLVAATCDRSKKTILQQLGIAREDSRKRVFVSWRGDSPPQALRIAAESSPDHFFLYSSDDEMALPENTYRIRFGSDLSFPDMIAVSDVVISKLGYGTLSACVAAKADLLFPPRLGFREDTVLQEAAQRYLRSCQMPTEDFATGQWRRYLELLRQRPRPCQQVSVDGADECARIICSMAASR